MNQLPKEWKWVKLGNIADITSSRRIFQEEYANEGIPFFRTKEIKELNEGKSISVELFITTEKYNEIKSKNEIPKIGDILISAVGTIGVSYIIKDSNPFYFKDGNLVWIRKLIGVIPKYLHFNFSHFIRFKQEITTSGSAYNALTIVKLKDYDIPLPPLPTQQAIVAKIEELFSELDKGIENLKIAQQQLKTYRQAVLKWAFEGKLTNENVREGELPVGWKKKRLGEMFDFIGGGTPSKSEKDYWNGNIFWASVKDVKGNYLNKTLDTITEKGLKNSASNLATPGDVILITRISPGKSIISNVNSAINQDLKIAKPKFKTSSKFINYFFNAIERDCIKIASGTTVLGITLNNLNELEIPDLNIVEQQKIVQEIESRLSIADKMEESINQSLQQAEALRQSILKKAFEGRLV